MEFQEETKNPVHLLIQPSDHVEPEFSPPVLSLRDVEKTLVESLPVKSNSPVMETQAQDIYSFKFEVDAPVFSQNSAGESADASSPVEHESNEIFPAPSAGIQFGNLSAKS